MSDEIQFVETNSGVLMDSLINRFEAAFGETLSPTDERYLFLSQFAQIYIECKGDINNTGKANLLRFAKGPVLDALGYWLKVDRLSAQKASTTIKFNLSAVQTTNIEIPEGTRVTPDGVVFFATSVKLTLPAGIISGTVNAVAVEAGANGNGFVPGQITTLVDPVSFVSNIENTTLSAGGSDIEKDDALRDRIHLAPSALSTAGPEDAYIYLAKTADSNIIDVKPTSPSANEVLITVLMSENATPSTELLNKVVEICSAKDKRPLTDHVTAASAGIVNYNINLTYFISADQKEKESMIKGKIEGTGGAVEVYNLWQRSKLGRDIDPDYLKSLIYQCGAYKVNLTSPIAAAVSDTQAGKLGTVSVTYGGLI